MWLLALQNKIKVQTDQSPIDVLPEQVQLFHFFPRLVFNPKNRFIKTLHGKQLAYVFYANKIAAIESAISNTVTDDNLA
jgi:hypothetical protein